MEGLNALFYLVQRSPPRQPSVADGRGALHSLHIVAADVERKGILLRLWKHFDVLVRVVFSVEGRDFFAHQFLKNADPLFHHLPAMRALVAITDPGLEFLAIGADADCHDESSTGHLVDRRHLLREINRLAVWHY